MHVTHSTFSLAGLRIHQIDFAPETFQPADLLWLPHHARLANCARKRQSEHLAGRIAAAHALREVAEPGVPAPGEQGQPLWPAPWRGSISHCGQRALAVVASRPTGIDIEQIFIPEFAAELAQTIATPAERAVLEACGLPFELALTLAFSAKESGFKALSPARQKGISFLSLRLLAIAEGDLRLQLAELCYRVFWAQSGSHVITLCAH